MGNHRLFKKTGKRILGRVLWEGGTVKEHGVTVVQHKPGWPSFGPYGERSMKININKLRRVKRVKRVHF